MNTSRRIRARRKSRKRSAHRRAHAEAREFRENVERIRAAMAPRRPFSMLGTTTGRLSSSAPNLQNFSRAPLQSIPREPSISDRVDALGFTLNALTAKVNPVTADLVRILRWAARRP